jgi:hypothetical protein
VCHVLHGAPPCIFQLWPRFDEGWSVPLAANGNIKHVPMSGLRITFRMRWDVLEVLDRRQNGESDEVLVHWACSWITREDYNSGRFAIAQTVMTRTIGLVEQVLVQWAVTWEPAAGVDQGLLDELGSAPAEAVDAGESADNAEVKSGGEAAKWKKNLKRRRRKW